MHIGMSEVYRILNKISKLDQGFQLTTLLILIGLNQPLTKVFGNEYKAFGF